jgi:hypothetical protein
MVGGIEDSQTVWSKDPHTGVETLRVTMPGPPVGSTGVMYVEVRRGIVTMGWRCVDNRLPMVRTASRKAM